MSRIFLFGFFESFLNTHRNAPLASESLCIYIKDILENDSELNKDIHIVNLANSTKSFCIERTKTAGKYHQIGTVSFGKIYRKLVWSKTYWKKVYKFCKKNVNKEDVLIVYHSLYLNKLFKKIKRSIGCKIVLIGAELYSSVNNNKKDKKYEMESYSYANSHILISNVLKNEISVNRPSIILSGNYKPLEIAPVEKFSICDRKIHLVYSGTFDRVKGGVYSSIKMMDYLDDNYVLHILGFGNVTDVKSAISKSKRNSSIIFEGTKTGDEFINFLSRCDIGLSTQDSAAGFNNSSFPSKIITYCKCGLSVVSTPSVSVKDSPFKDYVTFSNSSAPNDIAEAVRNCRNNMDPLFIKHINSQFIEDFKKMLNVVCSSKTFVITNNYYGGSTGNISRSIQQHLLDSGHTCYFAYHLGKKMKTPYTIRYGYKFEHYLSPLLARFTGNSLGYMLLSTKKLLTFIKKINPDLVNVHCMNSYTVNVFKFLNFLKFKNYKTVITNHALFYATGTCGYPFGDCEKYIDGCGKCPNKRYSCKSYFIDRTHKNWKQMEEAFKNSTFYMTSVSNYVNEFCSLSPITKHIQNKTILNGVDVDAFKYHSSKKEDAAVHILYVSSSINNSNKGFGQFLRILERFKNNNQFVFHVVGQGTTELRKYNNVVAHGFVANKETLSKLYSMCDLFVITSRRETFSLPVAESLCCGTPVAGYKCGGPESFLKGNSSKFFDYGNLDQISDYIFSKVYLNINKAKLSEESVILFSSKRMTSEYSELFRKITESTNE